MMKKLFTLICLCLSLFLLAGCQKDPVSPQQSSTNDKSDERTAPDDDPANHGVLAIMETENGYYYNYGYSTGVAGKDYNGSNSVLKHLLRYYDKATGATILLCSKPECEHQGGDTCAATYKNLYIINSVLYDGQIYIYGLEKDQNMLRMNLYRAALDGSSMDLVGTVLEAENTLGEGVSTQSNTNPFGCDDTFIIHRGYAYLPYYMRIGAASKGFMGGGVVQMDLRTGKTKIIYEMEYLNSYYPYNLKACGDYVYIDLNGTKRYVISEDRLEYPPALQEERNKPRFGVVTEDRLYSLSRTYHEATDKYDIPLIIEAYDGITGVPLPEENFETDLSLEEYETTLRLFPYKGMMVIAAGNRVVFYDIEGNGYGTKLAEIGINYEQVDISINYFEKPADIKISNDKLYLICNPTQHFEYMTAEYMNAEYMNAEYNMHQGDYKLYQVYSCPVEDILKGHGTWEKAFEFQPK